ncbi:MAG: calcium/sodium antiporter [Candidatus Thermoplasmatota archaeon]|nr:calcium/sodium antiporter [Candidatus Thermoplasmatota archaeon]
MLLSLAGVAAGLFLLILGANCLVDGGAGIAKWIGVSGHVIGITLIAAATSLPELATSITASFEGYPGLAVGNVVGSNGFNIGMVLGIAVIIAGMGSSRFMVRDGWMVILSTVLFGVFSIGTISRVESIVLLVIFFLYVAYLFRVSRPSIVIEEDGSGRGRTYKLVLLTVVGFLMLFFGSPLLVRSSVVLADHLGVGNSLIGLSLIAAGTSLPELLTSIVAMTKKQTGIAVGNVLGSNIFNILLIIGLSGIIHPIDMAGIMNPGVVPGMILLTVLGILLSRKRMGKLQGAMLIFSYVLFFILMLPFAW